MAQFRKKIFRNQNGFSLIELMIAVVIIAIAAFGIFQAFGTAFQSMNDSKDRTEAINFIQESFEKYRNMDFKKITDSPMAPISGTKYSRGSIVINISEPGEETRLKKVITQVRWPDREGNIKTEEASTVIFFPLKTGELTEPSEIVLYADPYYRMLPDSSTKLIAEIHDENGNLVDWSGTIYFNILSGSEYGELSDSSVTTSNGIGIVTYASYPADPEVYVNEDVEIEASATVSENNVSDTILIQITNGAEGIILIPDDSEIPVNQSVNVNLFVTNAEYDVDNPMAYEGTITLSAEGPGTLSTESVTAPSGTANFNITSTGEPGIFEITASALDLDLGYTEITFTGSPISIQLTADDETPYVNETTNINITILDINDNPTDYTGTVTLTGGPYGDEGLSVDFVDSSSKTVSFVYDIEGTVVVNGTAIDLEQDSIEMEILSSLVPTTLVLTAIPTSVPVSDEDGAILTATVFDNSFPAQEVPNYSENINFTVVSGLGYFLDGENQVSTIYIEPQNGYAYVNLYSDSPGISTIQASSDDLILDPSEGVQVTFYSTASYITLSTDKSSVIANEQDYATLTATIYDDNDQVVTNYGDEGELITFTLAGTGYIDTIGTTSLYVTPSDGIAQVQVYSNSTGTCTISASSTGLTSSEEIPITFTEPNNPVLTLDESSVQYYTSGSYGYLVFNIEVENADLDLEEMYITWTNNKPKLQTIEIKSPSSDINYNPIFDVSAVSSPYTKTNINKLLLEGISTFRLTFDQKNQSNNVSITFYDQEMNDYPIPVIGY